MGDAGSLVQAYIGLGGNLNNPTELLRSARRSISTTPGIREIACSSLYRSAPMGPRDQPYFVNAVMAVETSLPPHELLDTLQAIESAHGRVRNQFRWGPRTLDLDLLIYGEMQIADDKLTVPHAGIADREFVLYPLAEIAPPDLRIPGKGMLSELLDACPLSDLEIIGNV